MDERSRRLARLLAVTEQMKRLEEWRAMQARLETESRKDRQRRLLQALESDVFRSIALSEVLSRHLRHAAEAVQEAQAREQKVREILSERHRQTSQIERIRERHAEIVRRLQERRDLADVIDMHMQRRADSKRR
ncbi:hypothetical protein [Thermopetrobacter sp. TC1]|uniref:hypothetical protein n=1 Tax=Thermopetrobacter sp. TC1 TaxID=1495045 RepID=UPI00056FA5BA|nr:hypothetical protein [Thermopetrobacter sp. TC1]